MRCVMRTPGKNRTSGIRDNTRCKQAAQHTAVLSKAMPGEGSIQREASWLDAWFVSPARSSSPPPAQPQAGHGLAQHFRGSSSTFMPSMALAGARPRLCRGSGRGHPMISKSLAEPCASSPLAMLEDMTWRNLVLYILQPYPTIHRVC